VPNHLQHHPDCNEDPVSFGLEVKIRASGVTDVKISSLRRRDRCEQRSVRLEVEQGRLVDAIKAAHIDRAAVNSLKQRNRRTDRIGAGGRAQRECAAGVSIISRALENKIAAREMRRGGFLPARRS